MSRPVPGDPFHAATFVPAPPRTPAWFWPAVMAVATVLAAGAGWLWPEHRRLAGFVPYTFLGNSLAPLPYDGAVMYLGAHYPIWLVVVIGTVCTLVIEAWNMELLARLLARDATRGFRSHPLTRWMIHWYGKAPFWTLVATSFLPIVPHYPMRVLATLAQYPMRKYMMSVTLGRGGRYTWLAVLGFTLRIPGWILFVASLILLALAVRGARRMNREGEAALRAGVEPS